LYKERVPRVQGEYKRDSSKKHTRGPEGKSMPRHTVTRKVKESEKERICNMRFCVYVASNGFYFTHKENGAACREHQFHRRGELPPKSRLTALEDCPNDPMDHHQFKMAPKFTPQLSHGMILEACNELLAQAGNDQGLLREVLDTIKNKTQEIKTRTLKRKQDSQGILASSDQANKKVPRTPDAGDRRKNF
jgi:hypothetical protein